MRQDSSEGQAQRSKRHLAVRMLVAKIAWLDGAPLWSAGRIAWQDENGLVTPAPSDLARAQRCLHKIRQYPLAAPQVLGDSQAWLVERQARLERIKRLSVIQAPDIPGLIERSGADAPDRLAALLPAEAVCVNSLPASPCRALVALGPRAVPALAASGQDPAALPETRVLIALTLGAVHGRNDGGEPPLFARSGPAARAYLWGCRRGLPSHPALAAILLGGEDGEALTARCLAAIVPDLPLTLSPETLRRLLHRGTSPRVVALAESVAAARPLAERLVRYRSELPDRRAPDRREAAQALHAQRQEALAVLSGLYEQYAMIGDPDLVLHLTAFLFSMLDLAPSTERWTEAVAAMLRRGLSLPPPLAVSYLSLLMERHVRGEGRPPLPTEPKDAVKRLIWQAEAQHKWLPERCRDAQALAVLLRRTGDARMGQEALAVDIHRALEDYDWADPEKYRWLLALAASLPHARPNRLAYRLCDLVNDLGHIETVRAALHPIMTALQTEAETVRASVWEALLDEVGWERAARRRTLPRLGRCVPPLAAFVRQTAHPGHLMACVAGLITVEQAQPEAASTWLDRLLADLLAREARGAAGITEQTIRTATALASALGGGDADRVWAILQASLDHALSIEEYRLEQGLSLLGRFPTGRAPLADIFPQQPRRCAGLLVRLGLTARLGMEALAPLRRLEPPGSASGYFPLPVSPDNGWWRLHQLCPELDSDAAVYQHTCWVRNQRFALPPGIRHALAQPERLAGELSHLERLATGGGSRPDLDKRRAKLRALLSDPEQLRADIRAVVQERLPRLAAEAQLAAWEQQIQTCYRTRLEELAGPLPADLALTDDLINAVLLAADISQNRRLLLRLLRAHLAGEVHWREAHPENRRFLEAQAKRGVNTAAWLAGRPRRYPCAGAAGGRVHLWLERDPLHVLQMGNYFDTCLSFDAFNAFSTVANACELNKRVLYARDGAGHIVGRKLIGIAESGALVGFRTYTSLAGPEANALLRAVFGHYAAAFASDCGLASADAGQVPTLFAEAWYDDGTTAWNEAASNDEVRQAVKSGILGDSHR